jgi:ferrous iron transport protein B
LQVKIQIMLLSELKSGESGYIVKVKGQNAFKRRISEMGFVRGQQVTVIKEAPFKDPIEYNVMGYMLSLRRQEASLIEVITETPSVHQKKYNGTTIEIQESEADIIKAGKTINIAMIGNPNSGKTSIFNYASRSHEKVGNYSGVTVGAKLAKVEYQGYSLNIYDLPGTYSLSTYSPEELYVREFLFENQPDIVINVLDSTNLERNLFLTTQLLDLNLKLVVALNMYDELNQNDKLDYKTFGKMIGVPMVPTVGYKGKGLAMLFAAVIDKFNESEFRGRRININYGKDVEISINKIQDEIKNIPPSPLTDRFCARFLAIKLIEKDEDLKNRIRNISMGNKVIHIAEKEIAQLELNTGIDTETIITDAKYGFIAGALLENLKLHSSSRQVKSIKIDKLLTHKYLGIPIFFALLWLTFQLTFRLGKHPTEWINSGIQFLSGLVSQFLADGALNHLLRDGILGGVGGVLVFLPNILVLFFFISLMEDTGYMARAAFIMDKAMHRIGLHGKSFIPLVMGFGCNVPAILATRIIESKNNRLVTMLILPFMSCSARLPIYILLIGTFFPSNQGTVLFFIYLTGIVLAGVSALLYKKFLVVGEDVPFVMELPPYRTPTVRNTLRHMWSQSAEYLKRIGGIILLASIIIWGLNYYPGGSKILNPATAEKSDINSQADEMPSSYLERFGRVIQPVMEPLGFDWKMSVSLLAGIPGKEIVLSTMGVLYDADEEDAVIPALEERIRDEKYTSGPRKGEKVFNPLVALTYLLFLLIYFPCVAVVASIARESGESKWAVFIVLYTTVMAWVLSFLFYQTGKFLLF